MADPTEFRTAARRIQLKPKARIIYLLGALLVLWIILYGACTTYVKPNEYGIKQVFYGPGAGIKKDVYTAGLRWVTWGTERMHTFPRDVQTLNMVGAELETKTDAINVAPLNIQTSEGYNVRVDISVLYRITDPYRIITQVGPGTLYQSQLVIPRAEQVLRKQLGALDAEEFYNVQKRHERVLLAQQGLNVDLNPSGIEVLHVFVRDYVYDERYQQAIEQRKIQDQSVFKNKAEADMAAANAEKDRIVAVGDAAVKVELARGQAEKAKLEAEAELYERKQKAAGELQLKLAEAEGTRLENEALRGTGSEAIVGLKMAEALKGTKVIIVPTDGPGGMNPLDLNGALKRFDVKE